MKIIPIAPKRLMKDVRKQQQVIDRALKNAATAARVDFRVTTQTWNHQPDFKIENTSSGNSISYDVKTDDKIYGYVNFGTRPHVIRPKRAKVLHWIGGNYRAKTVPKQIRSRKGGNDNTIVFAKFVQHPGNEAREFDITIRDKWQDELPKLIQSAIDEFMQD